MPRRPHPAARIDDDTPGLRTFALPYLVPGRDQSQAVSVLNELEEHVAHLKLSMFLDCVARYFPTGVAQIELRAKSENEDGEDGLWFEATGWARSADGALVEVALPEDWGLEIRDYSFAGSPAFERKVMDLMGPQAVHPGLLSRAGFRAWARSAWGEQRLAQIKAWEMDDSLPAPAHSPARAPRRM